MRNKESRIARRVGWPWIWLACSAGLVGLWSPNAFGQSASPAVKTPPVAMLRGDAVPTGREAPADVAEPPDGAVKTSSGLALEVLQTGSGTQHPQGDDCVILRFTAWKRDGSLYSTSGLRGETSTQCLTAAIPGIAEALKTMAVGDKTRVWVPSNLAFAAHVAHHQKKKMMDDAPPMVDLTIDVELVRILTAPLTPTDLRTPPRGVLRTRSGVAIEVLQAGGGTEHPGANSHVTLNYSCWTADGQLHESTIMSGHPAILQLGTALPSLREALQYLVAGEKARLWIPARLAHGEHPIDRMVPAGDLVYDVELLSFN